MRLLAITTVLFFSILAGAQNSIPERIKALEVFETNQIHYNEEESARLGMRDAQSQNALAVKLDDIRKEQDKQSKAIDALDGSMTQLKTIGSVVIFGTGLLSAWTMFALSRKQRSHELEETREEKSDAAILARLTILEDFKKQTDLRTPLLTELAQTVRNGFIGVVHHPDDSHGAADDLLDLVGGPMTPDERKRLDDLMAERQQDKKVSQRERSLAEALPKIMNLIDKFIALQNDSDAVNATEIPYGDTAPKLEDQRKPT